MRKFQGVATKYHDNSILIQKASNTSGTNVYFSVSKIQFYG